MGENPKQWEWLGGREWQLVVDGVHAQYFENGIIFGPIPISYNIIYGTRIFSVFYSTNKWSEHLTELTLADPKPYR
jgi:hypothetical protein